MKKILLLSTVLVTGLLAVSTAHAQFSASINIGVQPAWGPSGYDYAENYYLPDVEAYYNVPSQQFVYFDGYNWVSSNYLPGRYTNYDLYSGYKVVINERNPWLHFNRDRDRFYGYRSRRDQPILRDYRNYGSVYGNPGYGGRGWHDREVARGFGYGRERREDHDDNRRFDRGDNHYEGGREGGFHREDREEGRGERGGRGGHDRDR